MSRSYSLDLRERVVSSVLSGQSCRAAAVIFGVSESSAIRWVRRYRETGTAAALARGGNNPLRLIGERDWLLARLEKKPDLTLHMLLRELEDIRGVRVCCDTLWRFLKRCGISFKKNRIRQRARPA